MQGESSEADVPAPPRIAVREVERASLFRAVSSPLRDLALSRFQLVSSENEWQRLAGLTEGDRADAG